MFFLFSIFLLTFLFLLTSLMLLFMSRLKISLLQEVKNRPDDDLSVVQLPIYVVLTNNTAVTYFADYLASVGGQTLIDCYLAVEV